MTPAEFKAEKKALLRLHRDALERGGGPDCQCDMRDDEGRFNGHSDDCDLELTRRTIRLLKARVK